jgi:hypothetical protein
MRNARIMSYEPPNAGNPIAVILWLGSAKKNVVCQRRSLVVTGGGDGGGSGATHTHTHTSMHNHARTLITSHDTTHRHGLVHSAMKVRNGTLRSVLHEGQAGLTQQLFPVAVKCMMFIQPPSGATSSGTIVNEMV